MLKNLFDKYVVKALSHMAWGLFCSLIIGLVVSQLLKDNLMEAVDIEQIESFEAGALFAAAEGIVPAPESCHAIAATIREAKRCKETGEAKTILFCLSGHGLIDMASYDQFLAGNLINNSISDETIAENLRRLER